MSPNQPKLEQNIGWIILALLLGGCLLVWGVAVSSVDNFVKPWIISQGSAMPFLLIFLGVIGGALAFGFIGVLIGPTLLAVGYRLVHEVHHRSSNHENRHRGARRMNLHESWIEQ